MSLQGQLCNYTEVQFEMTSSSCMAFLFKTSHLGSFAIAWLNALITRKNHQSFHSHSVCYHKHFKCDAKMAFSPKFVASSTLWWRPSCLHVRTYLIPVLWGQPILSTCDCAASTCQLLCLYSWSPRVCGMQNIVPHHIWSTAVTCPLWQVRLYKVQR